MPAVANLGPSAPVSRGWNEGDLVAERLFAGLGALELENGKTLPGTELVYGTWGEPNAEKSNVILALHALTTDAHMVSEATEGQATSGRWNEIVGPGKVIDTEKFFVSTPNVPGGRQGSTGSSSLAPDGTPQDSRFPVISTRGQVAAEALLADQLSVESFSPVVGASLGGHRTIKQTVGMPEQVCRLIVIASGAHITAEQAAWTYTQLRVIELGPAWQEGDYYTSPDKPSSGLALARQIAHTTYRFPEELGTYFGRYPWRDEDPLHGGRLAVESYLDYHGTEIVNRFDAGSYVVLTRSMLSHDAGHERGGISEASARTTATTLVVAVDSDRLFFPEQLHRIVEQIPGAIYRQIYLDYGHDGFLLEYSQLTAMSDEFLGDTVQL